MINTIACWLEIMVCRFSGRTRVRSHAIAPKPCVPALLASAHYRSLVLSTLFATTAAMTSN